MPIKIIFNASEISGIGQFNPYTTQQEVLCKIVSRNPCLQEVYPLPKYHSTNVEQKLSELLPKELEKIYSELNVEISPGSNEDKKVSLETVSKHISSIFEESVSKPTEEESKMTSISIIQKYPSLNIVATDIEKDIRMKRGTDRESNALESYMESAGTEILYRNDRVYRKVLFIINDVEYRVHGKIDGIDKNGTIVETKNRRNGFFSNIPLYERVQLEVYMWMLDKNVAIHIQNYNGTSKYTRYEKDRSLWDKIVEKVRRYVETKFESLGIKHETIDEKDTESTVTNMIQNNQAQDTHTDKMEVKTEEILYS